MKCIAGVFLFAATIMAQALVSPIAEHELTLAVAAGTPAYTAMTASERWRQYAHDNFTGRGAFLRSLKTAAFQEMTRHPQEWPSTGSGFAQRFGSSFARNAIQGSISDGLAAAFRHDTRYLPCRCSGIHSRLMYAVQMSFFTRNERGARVVDISKFTGIYGGAVAIDAWQTHHSSLPADSARLAGIGVGSSVLTNIAREFTPELKQMVHRR
jgi:hypothetical protein